MLSLLREFNAGNSLLTSICSTICKNTLRSLARNGAETLNGLQQQQRRPDPLAAHRRRAPLGMLARLRAVPSALTGAPPVSAHTVTGTGSPHLPCLPGTGWAEPGFSAPNT